MDVSTSSCQSISEFKRELLGQIRPPKRTIFNIYDIEEIKLLTRLRVEFSHLRDRQNFHCLNPTCPCQTGTEDNEHFLLQCPRISFQWRVPLDLVSKSVNFDIMRLSSKELCSLLLYGHSKCTITTNCVIAESTLEYIKSTHYNKKAPQSESSVYTLITFVDMIDQPEGVHEIKTHLFSISLPQLSSLQVIALESTNTDFSSAEYGVTTVILDISHYKLFKLVKSDVPAEKSNYFMKN